MEIYNCPQQSEEWHLLRLGKVTASCFSKAIAKPKTKGGVAKTSRGYMIQLIAEIMTGEPQETYSNPVMQRGTEVEPEARQFYEEANGVVVTQVGFVERDEHVGCSPDGLVGDDGMLEIKCPNSATHIEYLLSGKFPSIYNPQVQGQLWVCERKWCDFVSFDPRIKDRPYFCVRVERDEPYIKELEIKLKMFVTEMQEVLEKLTYSPF